MEMTGKERIRRVIEHDAPDRIGYAFSSPEQSDLLLWGADDPAGLDLSWRPAADYRAECPALEGFRGFVRKDEYGNFWGRVESDAYSKGEVLWGALPDWDALDAYELPPVDDPARYTEFRQKAREFPDCYLVGELPGFPFSVMRNLRRFEDFLMDVLLEPENVQALGRRVTDQLCRVIDCFADAGADAVMAFEDWGTQDRLLIGPAQWRALFGPLFEQLAAHAHARGLKLILHSCGYLYDVLDDMAAAGVDVFQFDQPTLMGEERVAALLSRRGCTLFAPVDIQKILPTGDRAAIEEGARRMMRLFGRGGGFIAKDYPDYRAIQVDPAWAAWAREVFYREGWYASPGALPGLRQG